jgi:hypothetical protein
VACASARCGRWRLKWSNAIAERFVGSVRREHRVEHGGRLGRSWQNDVDELRRSSVMAAQAGESELAGLIAEEEADSRGAAHREIVATLLEQGPPGLGAPEPTSSRSAACPCNSDDRSTGIRNP